MHQYGDGKTQTKYPWGSPKDAPEPNPWFHEIFHKNGTAYDESEVNVIMDYCNRKKINLDLD